MMKKIISIALAISLVGGASAFVYADDTVEEVTTITEITADAEDAKDTAGILPDSPWYSLELKIEQLQTEIIKSQERLALLKAEFAAERAAEAVIMANAEEKELAVEAAKKSIGLLTSSAKLISKAIEAKDDAAEIMETVQNALDEQDKAITVINDFYAAKSAFFEAKEQLAKAKMELKIAREGGGPEAIQIAEDKVKEAEALKDELEELKAAAESAKDEMDDLADQAEKSIEKGLKQVEKANAKMDRLEEKAAKDAQKLEEKMMKENSKEEIKNVKEKAKEKHKEDKGKEVKEDKDKE